MKKIIPILFLLALPLSAGATAFYVGDGTAGAKTISTTVKEDGTKTALTATALSGQKVVVVSSTTGFSANDWVFLHQTQSTTTQIGNYEFMKISTVDSGTQVTMSGNLVSRYEYLGAQMIRVPQYTTYTLNAGGMLTADAWNGTTGGIVALMLTGAFTENSGATTSALALGFRSGARCTSNGCTSTQGEATTTTGSASLQPNSGGGGGETCVGTDAADGNGGSYASIGTSGFGNASCTSQLVGRTDAGNGKLETGQLIFGGAGGGTQNGDGASRGNPSNSGGIIIIVSGGNITLSGTTTAQGTGDASIYMGGVNIANTEPCASSGRCTGAGAGGSIRLLTANTIANGSATTSAVGGPDEPHNPNNDSGVGGVGRIATITSATVTGATSPSINTSSTDTVTTTNPYPGAGSSNNDDNSSFMILLRANPLINKHLALADLRWDGAFGTPNLPKNKTHQYLILLLQKKILELKLQIAQLKRKQVFGAITDATATILPSITGTISTTTDLLSVTPSVSKNGNIVTFSANGTFNDCLYSVNQDAKHLTAGTSWTEILPSGSYPYSLWCATQGHQPKGITGNFLIP